MSALQDPILKPEIKTEIVRNEPEIKPAFSAQPAAPKYLNPMQQLQWLGTFRKPKFDPLKSELPYFTINLDFPGGQNAISNIPGFQTLDQIIPAPKRLREKFNYQSLSDIPIWVETPDLQDFANELFHYHNREELIHMIKNRANDVGIKVNLPYGSKSQSIYVNCNHYKAYVPGQMNAEEDGTKLLSKTNPKQKKAMCPFSLIFKKIELCKDNKDLSIHPAYKFPQYASDPKAAVAENERLSQGQGIGVYYLAKFRGLHNHPLEMNLFDLSQHGDANRIDPARLTYEGKIYENKNKRFTNEKAVITDTFCQAQRDVIFG